jgi:streptogramin lyase
MMQRVRLQTVAGAGALFAMAVLSGCGSSMLAPSMSSTSTASTPVTVAAKALQGTVMGGQQPVAGVTLQLYQAGTSGYGSAATPLGSTATTNAGGNFNLPSYTCAPGSQVYLVGTGGQPSPLMTNGNLALMTGLGTCGGTYLSSFINVNELTTVATVWALAPFMINATHIGTSSTNTTGLAEAFAAINQIVATTNGTTPGPTLPAGATLPAAEINTLADILEQCINSSGGTTGDSSPCGNLFNLAPNAAGTVYPTDTIIAAMNIAQNPGRNVANLNKLRSASPVFQPALDVNSPPNAWTIAITYTGGGTFSSPSSIAADAGGNIWIANAGSNSVTKLDATGAALFNTAAGGFNSPSAIAIDGSGNAWIANAGNGSVTKLNSAGSSGTAYSGNGLNAPKSIAVDGNGNIWVANSGSNAVSAFTSSGTALSGSPFSGAGATTPVSVAATPK